MEYRILSRQEIGQLSEIDRTETIEHVYQARDGKLVLKREHWDVSEWSVAEKRRRIAGLRSGYDAGDTLFGAFDGPVLADPIDRALFEEEPNDIHMEMAL